MNAKFLALALAPLMLAAVAPVANAADYNQDRNYKRINFVRNVDASVTALENGYQVVLTSDKQRYQNRLQNTADTRESYSRYRVDKTVNTVDGGITVTKTTDAQYLGNRLSRRATYPKATVYRWYNRGQ